MFQGVAYIFVGKFRSRSHCYTAPSTLARFAPNYRPCRSPLLAGYQALAPSHDGVAACVRELLGEVLFSEFVDIGADVTNAISISYDENLAEYATGAVVVAGASSLSFLISVAVNGHTLVAEEALLAQMWSQRGDEVVGDNPEATRFSYSSL